MSKETSIKKKRKAAPESENDVDVYKKVIEYEEKEAANSSSAAKLKICQERIEEVTKLIADVSQNRAKNQDFDKYDVMLQVTANICVIKHLNRIDKIGQVTGKEILNSEKQKCDSIKLSYQNLLYELHHLINETNKCLAFKSQDEDIELVSFEEFMKDAPKELASKFKNMSTDDTDTEHNLKIARLEWELTQRKSLAELYKSLEEEEKTVVAEIDKLKEKLSNTQPLLANVLKATKAVQEHLDSSCNAVRSDHRLADLLPTPLYIFYANVMAYKNVFNVILQVSIIGDEDEASQWKESEETPNNDEESEPEADLPDVEEVVEVKKRRHRKSVQVDPMEEKKNKLLEFHPLSVQVVLPVDDGPKLTFSLRYYTKLQIVTVLSDVDIPPKITANTARELLSGENILIELIENDLCLESPNPNTIYQLKKVGISSYQSIAPQIGYAYTWAQRICGFDFLTSQKCSSKVCQQNMETVMKTLQKRLTTKTHLAKQMQHLEQNMISKLPANTQLPNNIVTSISKWTSTTYQAFCQAEFTQFYVEEEFVSPSDMFYSLILNRANAKVQAYVVIKNTYPDMPPLFSLCVDYNGKHHSGNSDDVREIESHLNSKIECGSGNAAWVLSVQITYLCAYIDIFLESMDPDVFPQSTAFFKRICGRNKRKPFEFKKCGSGIFTQY